MGGGKYPLLGLHPTRPYSHPACRPCYSLPANFPTVLATACLPPPLQGHCRQGGGPRGGRVWGVLPHAGGLCGPDGGQRRGGLLRNGPEGRQGHEQVGGGCRVWAGRGAALMLMVDGVWGVMLPACLPAWLANCSYGPLVHMQHEYTPPHVLYPGPLPCTLGRFATVCTGVCAALPAYACMPASVCNWESGMMSGRNRGR